jgi:hypothetical protein
VKIVAWLGSAAPVRSVRWLDGALCAVAKFDDAVALAAGDVGWLDLAADRAARVGLPSVGITTELQLDYLGWAQIVAAAARELTASTIVVDEASQPGRFAEVAAIAELTGAVQLSGVTALAFDHAVIHATCAIGRENQTIRLRDPAVIGVRIPGDPVDDYPTPVPSATLRRLDVDALGIDPLVLARRAIPPCTSRQPRQTIDRVADYLAVHLATRREG